MQRQDVLNQNVFCNCFHVSEMFLFILNKLVPELRAENIANEVMQQILSSSTECVVPIFSA